MENTLSEKVETAADLKDFIDMAAVVADSANNGTTFEDEIRAQMLKDGVEASDEAIIDLVQELEQDSEEDTEA